MKLQCPSCTSTHNYYSREIQGEHKLISNAKEIHMFVCMDCGVRVIQDAERSTAEQFMHRLSYSVPEKGKEHEDYQFN